jgi:hypothetical protein
MLSQMIDASARWLAGSFGADAAVCRISRIASSWSRL